MDSVRLVHHGDRIVAVGGRDSVTVESSPVVITPSQYDGPYEVTPTLPGFGMDTHGKYMRRDVTVNPIPINETSNPQNGYTVVIG